MQELSNNITKMQLPETNPANGSANLKTSEATTTTTTTRNPPTLLTIPGEIRNQIWEEVFPPRNILDPDLDTIDTLHHDPPFQLPGLTQTCKQIHAETLPMTLSSHHIIFTLEQAPGSPDSLKTACRWLRSMGDLNLKHMLRFTIKRAPDMSSCPESDECSDSDDRWADGVACVDLDSEERVLVRHGLIKEVELCLLPGAWIYCCAMESHCCDAWLGHAVRELRLSDEAAVAWGDVQEKREKGCLGVEDFIAALEVILRCWRGREFADADDDDFERIE